MLVVTFVSIKSVSFIFIIFSTPVCLLFLLHSVLMRREQIHKICLNHLLTAEIEYKPKDPKSWQFIANDYTDGNLELDNFSLRFKTEEIAKEFKKTVDDIRASVLEPNVNGTTAAACSTTTTTTSSNVTAEELKNITCLKMNGNFYDYKVKDDCPGCRGCNEDYVFREVKDTNFGQIDDNPLPLTPPPKVDMCTHNDLSKDTKKSGQPNPFSFGSSGGNGFSFGAAIAAATAANTSATQQSGTLFGNNSFKFTTPEASADGDSKDANNSGQTNLFGGNSTKTTPSAETITPSFSFNSPVFGGLKCMCISDLFRVCLFYTLKFEFEFKFLLSALCNSRGEITVRTDNNRDNSIAIK